MNPGILNQLRLTALASLLLLGAACTVDAQQSPTSTAPTPGATSTRAQQQTAQDGNELVAAFQGVLQSAYERVLPSVVNLRVATQVGGSSQLPGQPRVQEGLGSGFVWDKDGHIVTNNHVVEGASRILVTFSDGSTATGDVLATDPDSDLAVVKVDVAEDRLRPVIVADSTDVRVGQLAIAIGNPFGLQGTMTSGIISALGRSLPVESSSDLSGAFSIPGIIQTDAAINPGNSGGVLLNASGQIIGVPSAIISSTQSSAGIGFAIPSSLVQKVVTSLIEGGAYEHPWLGVSIVTLTPDLAEAMNLPPQQTGALVEEVAAGSPADTAGIRGSGRTVTVNGRAIAVGGDVIVGINSLAVRTSEDVIGNLAQAGVGDEVKVTVLRDGDRRELTVTLAARPG